MRTSAAGIALIKEFEGCRLTGYFCPAGKATIGYGHTAEAGPPGVTVGQTITAATAERILRADLRAVEDDVAGAVRVPLNQGQFDALVSFTFNLGLGSLTKSTLLKKLNQGQYDAVPGELMKWTKARVNGELTDLPGLVKRRRAEAALWRSIDDSPPEDPEESRVTPVAPKPSKTMAQSKEGNGAIVAGAGAAAGAATAAEGIGQVVAQADQASSLASAVLRLMESPRFWTLVLCLAGAGAAAGVWFWRRRRLQEEGA